MILYLYDPHSCTYRIRRGASCTGVRRRRTFFHSQISTYMRCNKCTVAVLRIVQHPHTDELPKSQRELKRRISPSSPPPSPTATPLSPTLDCQADPAGEQRRRQSGIECGAVTVTIILVVLRGLNADDAQHLQQRRIDSLTTQHTLLHL